MLFSQFHAHAPYAFKRTDVGTPARYVAQTIPLIRNAFPFKGLTALQVDLSPLTLCRAIRHGTLYLTRIIRCTTIDTAPGTFAMTDEDQGREQVSC
jgi:hypothetical protein